MNIAKKLLFGLLLGGALLTAACSDDAKAQKGDECTKEKLCDDKLVCLADSAGAEKGKCADKCDPAKCNGTKECREDSTKKLKDADKAPQVCADKDTDNTPIALGKPCPNEGDTCVEGATCVTLTAGGAKTCEQTCTPNASDAEADVDTCPTGKKKCKAASDPATTNVCQAPAGPQPIALGKPCPNEGDTCVEGAACVTLTAGGAKTCEQTCTPNSSDAEADVDTCPTGKKKCKAASDPATTNVCQAA